MVSLSAWFCLVITVSLRTGIIAFNIYLVLGRGKGKDVENYEPYYHLVAWGFPTISVVVAGSMDAFGDAGNWCAFV
jgi:hypothetical protein